MKGICLASLAAFLISACATQMVENNATESCAKQNKRAFIFDSKQSGIPLIVESASASYLCVGSDDVTRLPAIFGADAVSASNFSGAGILSVTPGSAADKAGIKANDIVYAFAERPIEHARDLAIAIDSMSPGEDVAVKLRRNGGKNVTATTHF